jgi:hypothetical protein
MLSPIESFNFLSRNDKKILCAVQKYNILLNNFSKIIYIEIQKL